MEQMIRGLRGQLELRQGAPAEALEELQRRLGVRLPEDYLAFLRASDGAEGPIGESSYVMLDGVDELLLENEGMKAIQRGFFIFGSNGGEEAYAFELRSGAMRVVETPYDVMGLDEPTVRAQSFTEFLRYLEGK